MRGKQRRDRLRAAAAPLEPVVDPYYVGADELGPDDRYRAPGWYWQPAGKSQPEYLAFDSIRAEFVLLTEQKRLWDDSQNSPPASR